ncbi:hypothetical protein THASP1DRAFT_23177 [Thamnocephalis sphaerospora]|uniref:DUF7137 domain-containing protein n=1 Tax=Thamnocephalis sphaerospora TaxID=78915 RepID=A0A4P9XS45_9FUNG|nr:hypothetical protein THASP1DRAFT_23177 [Thamnocephalis sphaerospora]|eukprot:RKP08926.1 hypothetical protein THASP1DRAFT_23177 [Thamnocephalis sphaerospora]
MLLLVSLAVWSAVSFHVAAGAAAEVAPLTHGLWARAPQDGGDSGDGGGGRSDAGNRGSARDTRTGSSNSTNSTDPVIDLNEPPAQIKMLQPPLTLSELPRYRIGENVTFKWEYSGNLRIPPRYLTLEITRDRRQYATIGNISAASLQYSWDTSKWDDQAMQYLLTEDRYYLFITDERGRDTNRSSLGGRLMPYSSTSIYLYNAGSDLCVNCQATAARMQSILSRWLLAAPFIALTTLLGILDVVPGHGQ